ncbi:MAG: hypothetical protein A2938_01305 [Candidatus Taylorbacteria bacterium RIFCSPLOWO2_01_FULL_48_100]|uniref:Multidrug ABC transporter substrate-binding protein n=1 Tax=Candidatus Taylorbacteria bacterium RIFCSPLOWO2_01_FULL_48_100 TaxID=1802322 RepID=A0A1G2NEG9_9BACT|nr:MAG: hypothetical protein A2938_01305 [Candidatus Taylorbacteria bacterium RIFCSPLOWO2_01_FULL_48_100]OHA40109.1 MAG: hypothetical protein A3J31_00775 [Candidatus Taylorbacteria bacterium RIFCSPLOWO2_02_FULL_48_16]
MKFIDLIKETHVGLSANKVRSGLTVLGIVIGISSVVAMISIGQGASASIESSIEGLGSNLLTIIPGTVQPGRGFVSSGRGSAETLKNADADAIMDIQGVAAVSPEYQQRFQIVSTVGNNTNSLVIGAVPAYETVRNVSVGVGSFITEQHLRSMGRVAVVGATVASDLFGEEEPLGKTIRVNRVIFKVIGVMEAKGSSGFFNADDMVIVPLSTMQKILSGAEHLSLIAVSVLNKDEMPLVQSEASSLLAARHRVTIDNPDFSIVSQADIVGALTQVTDTFTIFLASIAGISLLVGGIGIMNMMLTTVTERTREIGLRKALGAKNRDISAQFLAEAIVLTVIGGIVGVILGWLISKTVSQVAGIATEVSLGAVLLAFGVSAGIGIVFGYYPARRASRLNPIEALRYE